MNDPTLEEIPDLILPDYKLNDVEFRQWRIKVYRRCEEETIRCFFLQQKDLKLPTDAVLFWGNVYTAIRVLTHTMWTSDQLRQFKVPEIDSDEDENSLQLDSLAFRAQIWLDRNSIRTEAYFGRFYKNGLLYILKKELYA